MKQVYILALLTAFTFSSCTKWLDVQPKTQIRESEQFSTEQGFKDALYGAYQKAAGRFLYGENLTLGFLEIMSQGYDNTTQVGHDKIREATYQYTDATVENEINSIWSEMYGTVAQVNYILKNVDGKKSIFTEDNYSIIKGEALGLRAFLHFDLLRLYAPSVASDAGALAIPYMTSFTVQPQARLKVSEVVAACIKDLKEAETLLSVYTTQDQITAPSSTSADNFLAYRQNRFNYWAVKALLARIYLYTNDKPNALKYATDVINSGNFRFITTPELNTKEESLNRTFTFEHVFSIYVSNLKTVSDSYFKTAATEKTSSKLIISETRKKDVFELAKGNGTDIRYASICLWNTSSGIVFPSKLWQVDENGEAYKKRIPVIKLSEMYYIAAESSPVPADGVAYLNKVLSARNIPELATTIDAVTLDNEIYKEYRKDFLCEGQLFYYYKRLNKTTITGALNATVNNEQYVLPLPKQEIEFGK
jgi:hypothetical protein